MPDLDDGRDGQDQSETYDETHLDDEGDADFLLDEADDVLDVTQAEGDADDDDALTAEDLTDDEIVELEQDEDPGDGRDVDDERPDVFDGE